jgi:hypothetical protein
MKKNDKMEKLMRKARVNLRVAKLRAVDFAKDVAHKVDQKLDEASKALAEQKEKMMAKEQHECKCKHCKCHEQDADGDKVEEAVEPEFVEMKVEEENQDEEK